MHPIMTELYVAARSQELLQEAERHRRSSAARSVSAPKGRSSLVGGLRRIAAHRSATRRSGAHRRARAPEAVDVSAAPLTTRTPRPAACGR